jgi:photosynthetic reaction center H subunit
MHTGSITSHIDVAQVVLYAFWVFFALLILYLRREDKREGYPLVEGPIGAEGDGVTPIPAPKMFRLADGRTVQAPSGRSDDRPLNAEPLADLPGWPLTPIGNPLLAGVGPGSYAERQDRPDVTITGAPRIVPLRTDPAFHLDPRDPDPRGMKVLGADNKLAGVVHDVWVDRSEMIIRYLEIEVAGAATVLLPMGLARINGWTRNIKVDSILSTQFAEVPGHRSPDQVTLLEEDKIYGYYGAGKLYATPSRAEPMI